MDVLAHALYGATACSRSGLAGGRRGAEGRRWPADATVWWAMLFGVLPDLISLGPAFAAFLAGGADGHFFRDIGSDDLTVYRYAHSLLVTLAVSAILRLARRPLAVPSLAWTLHVVMDAFTHGEGKFGTTVLYPVSNWVFEGVRWWQHPRLMAAYWLALPCAWLALHAWRRGARARPGAT